MDQLGKWMVVAGLGLAALGGLVLGLERLGLPLGRLPGDVAVEREGVSIYFPIATMLLISLALSGALWLLGALKR